MDGVDVLTGALVGIDNGVDTLLHHGERAGESEPGVGDAGGKDDSEESGERWTKHFGVLRRDLLSVDW